MSLYRKYRPASLADVVGQEHIVTTLGNAVSQDKLSHAYLFSGPRGTGKTSVARILARVLLTQGMADPALRRQIEKGVEEGTVVDLIEIDAASNRGIDDIRSLIEKIQFTPVVAAAKVYIIDEVHMLTKEAFNALLKTLEEPPDYACFILATTELQKIPATIQSRCQRYAFRQIREEDLVTRLQYITDQEGIAADRAALRAIARHAAGGLRDAIALLDQLRSLAKITVEDVKERTGETGHEYVEAIVEALSGRKEEAIVEIIRRTEEAGVSMDVLARALLQNLRAELHAAIDAGQPSGELVWILDVLLQAIRDMRVAPVPSLVLESALLCLCQKDDGGKKTSFFSLKRPKKETTPSAAVSAPLSPAEEKDTSSALIEVPELTLDSIVRVWPQVVEGAKPPSVKMSLKNGRVTAVSGQRVQVSFSSRFHRDTVAAPEACRHLENVLETFFKRRVKMECIVEEEHAAAVADPSAVDLAEAAAEVF